MAVPVKPFITLNRIRTRYKLQIKINDKMKYQTESELRTSK